jgi:curli biogenesis system outer membrane secretion channel CsgG
MKLLAVILFMSALVIAASCASGPSLRSVEPIDYNKRMLVAVSDIQNQTGNQDYDPLMGGLTGRFAAELHETECFRVIERQKLKSIIEEMKLGVAGLTDPAKTIEVGKMAGAKAILFVNLASVTYSSKKDSTFFAQDVKEEIETIMDARLVAVETGEILAASKISIPFTNRYSSFCFF